MSDSMQCHIHHVTLVSSLPTEEIRKKLSNILKDDAVHLDYGYNTYKNQYQFYGGSVSLNYTNGRPDKTITIHGKACEQIGTQAALDIYLHLEARATRIDMAIDNTPFTPGQVRDHCQLGMSKQVKNIRSKVNRKSLEWRENYQGQTVYIGSRTSQRYARIYNRNKNENGENFTRFELEMRRIAADKSIQHLIVNRDCLQDSFIGLIRDFIDFTEPTDEKNISRAKLAPFWESFVKNVDKISLKVTKPVSSTVEKTIDYVMKNASNLWVTALAMVEQYHISLEEACIKILEHGHHKCKTKHFNQINSLKSMYPEPVKLGILYELESM